MPVVNVHSRLLHASPARVGALLDTLASPQDALWPHHSWPRMKLDRPLAVGAKGGHGPIRYCVEAYTPGQSVRFRFTGPSGFDGWHALTIREAKAGSCVLEHRLEMRLRGTARLTWPLVFRPLHDALLEDAMATVEASLGLRAQLKPWSPFVGVLRELLTPRVRRPHAG